MCLAAPAAARAQGFRIDVTVDPVRGLAVVQGQTPETAGFAGRSLVFPRAAIGYPNLEQRISGVEFGDAAGREVAVRQVAPSIYWSEASFSKFKYNVNLRPNADFRAAAHASWLNGDTGLLFLDDVVVFPGTSKPVGARMQLAVPLGWKVATTESESGPNIYDIDRIDRAVFVLAKELRSPHSKARSSVGTAIAGRWLFTDAEASDMVGDIFAAYARVFGQPGRGHDLVVIVPIPVTSSGTAKWEAETRGSTVVIASGDMAFKNLSVQRLHEQLRHEIFHLWVPNALNLTGRYDWFYEGFALYGSLKLGVQLNQIRFEDFLDTLSRAYAVDRDNNPGRSMLDTSVERWTGGETEIYSRGMLIAFLCDLILLDGSGKNPAETLVRSVLSENRPGQHAVDANTAVLNVFEADPRTARVAADYVRGDRPLEWSKEISAAGIEYVSEPGFTGLRIKRELSGRQKAMLDKLGYNSWHKLTRK